MTKKDDRPLRKCIECGSKTKDIFCQTCVWKENNND